MQQTEPIEFAIAPPAIPLCCSRLVSVGNGMFDEIDDRRMYLVSGVPNAEFACYRCNSCWQHPNMAAWARTRNITCLVHDIAHVIDLATGETYWSCCNADINETNTIVQSCECVERIPCTPIMSGRAPTTPCTVPDADEPEIGTQDIEDVLGVMEDEQNPYDSAIDASSDDMQDVIEFIAMAERAETMYVDVMAELDA